MVLKLLQTPDSHHKQRQQGQVFKKDSNTQNKFVSYFSYLYSTAFLPSFLAKPTSLQYFRKLR